MAAFNLNAAAEAQDAERIPTGLRARLRALDRLSIEFRLRVGIYPNTEAMELEGARVGGGVLRVIRGEAERVGVLHWDRWRNNLTAVDTPTLNTALRWERSMASRSLNRCEELTQEPGSRPSGIIRDRSLLPSTQYLDVALGLRPPGSTNRWTEEELQGLARTNGNEPDVLRHQIQEGHDQHLTLNPQLKYALVDHAGFSRSGEPFVVARCREFEDFSGLLWPTEIHWKFYDQDGSAYCAMDYDLAAASSEPPEEFRMRSRVHAAAYRSE